MTLPFLKHDQEVGSASMNVEDDDYSMLDAVAEDIIMALKKSDKSMLKEALSALCDYIKEQDEIQDSKEEKESNK